jgi:hypothetical protein
MTTPKPQKAVTPAVSAQTSLERRIAITTAKGWRPTAPGDKFENALLIGLRMHHDEQYGDTPVFVYELEDGSYLALYAFHKVLRDTLQTMTREIGVSRHTVVFLGTETSNTRTRKGKDGVEENATYEMYYAEDAGTDVQAVSADFQI